MAVDYAAIAAGMDQALPFNAHVGLQTLTVAPDHGVVRLPEAAYLHNHVGSQHAGALFTAGEAASGAAFVGAFLEIMGEITPLAESAEIDYRKLAKGEITATARFSEDRDALFATAARGRSRALPDRGRDDRSRRHGGRDDDRPLVRAPQRRSAAERDRRRLGGAATGSGGRRRFSWRSRSRLRAASVAQRAWPCRAARRQLASPPRARSARR